MSGQKLSTNSEQLLKDKFYEKYIQSDWDEVIKLSSDYLFHYKHDANVYVDRATAYSFKMEWDKAIID